MVEVHVAWRELFLALTDDLFREFGLEAPSHVQDPALPLSMGVQIHGVDIDVSHHPFPGPSRVVIELGCGDLGKDPIVGLKRLLHLQHLLDPVRGKSFGVRPGTDHVSLIQCVDLQGLCAAELLRVLEDLSETVAELVATEWLEGPASLAAPPDFMLMA